MIPNEDALILVRFGEKRWMDRMIQGEVSFSCIGAFIKQAIKTGNNVQGDRFEGVFARLRSKDPKIEEMSNLLGKDLEIIEDNDYILLRRKSSKFKPIFCLYAYTAEDALNDGNITKEGEVTIRHDFNNQMFMGFASSTNLLVLREDYRFSLVMLQPEPFVQRIRMAMFLNNLPYTMKRVNYSLFEQETFFIQPTDNYDELFYKFPQYAYQHEARICLKQKKLWSVFDRYNLNIGKLSKEDYNVIHTKAYFTVDAIVEEKD